MGDGFDYYCCGGWFYFCNVCNDVWLDVYFFWNGEGWIVVFWCIWKGILEI